MIRIIFLPHTADFFFLPPPRLLPAAEEPGPVEATDFGESVVGIARGWVVFEKVQRDTDIAAE